MKIIMYPPYSKHLKILSHLISLYPNAEVVNLSPCDGFINMNVQNKLNKAIAPHIDDMTVISEKDANTLFGIYISSKLGIIHLKKGATGWQVDNAQFESICQKLRKHKSIRSSINTYDETPSKPYTSVQGDYGYAKGWHYTLDQLFTGKKVNSKIMFDTQEEVDNFIWTTVNTWPYKLMYKIDDNAAVIAHMPFLGDYTHPWNDTDLYEYFRLSDDEIKIIEKEIK